MITKEWRKFKGWGVLEFFLKTGKEIYVKEIARKLKISPQTANYYLKFYKQVGILKERKKGNLLLYSLIDNCLTRQLKIFYILDVLYPLILKFYKENDIISVVLYGSHASGTYDRNSDIDLLIISQKKILNMDGIRRLEKKIGKEVKIHVFSLGEWRSLKRKKDSFVRSVLSNYILICGAEI
jgi:hypothetical protein